MGKEAVNHPDHYNFGKLEVIEVIENWGLGFTLGNAVKYIARAGKKDDAKEDLEKAIWYLKYACENGCYRDLLSPSIMHRGRITLKDVLDDWKLPEDLKLAVGYIYWGTKDELTMAIRCIQSYIHKMKKE